MRIKSNKKTKRRRYAQFVLLADTHKGDAVGQRKKSELHSSTTSGHRVIYPSPASTPSRNASVTSVQSATVSAQPAARMSAADMDVVTPTTAQPAATPALMPVRESSKTTQSEGVTPRRRVASRYGSGCGFARAHSAPTWGHD